MWKLPQAKGKPKELIMALNEGQIVTLADDYWTPSPQSPNGAESQEIYPACGFYAALQQYHLMPVEQESPPGRLGFN